MKFLKSKSVAVVFMLVLSGTVFSQKRSVPTAEDYDFALRKVLDSKGGSLPADALREGCALMVSWVVGVLAGSVGDLCVGNVKICSPGVAWISGVATYPLFRAIFKKVLSRDEMIENLDDLGKILDELSSSKKLTQDFLDRINSDLNFVVWNKVLTSGLKNKVNSLLNQFMIALGVALLSHYGLSGLEVYKHAAALSFYFLYAEFLSYQKDPSVARLEKLTNLMNKLSKLKANKAFEE